VTVGIVERVAVTPELAGQWPDHGTALSRQEKPNMSYGYGIGVLVVAAAAGGISCPEASMARSIGNTGY
jgi:hypothetical protein